MDDDVDFATLLADLFQDTPLQNGQDVQELLPPPAQPFPSLDPIELPLLQPLPSYNPQSGLTAGNESSSSQVPSYVLGTLAWPQAQLPPPAEPAVPKAAAPRERRKRVSSVQQQVADLQQQLLIKEAQAKNLAMNNIWLTERMKMVETVISARDSQRSRLQLIQQGLGDFNPFAGFRTTVEAMQDVTPSQVADLILDVTGNMAMRLATLQPLLRTNPHLLTHSVHPTATMPVCRPDGTPNPEAIIWWRPDQPRLQASLPALVDHTYASLLPDLQSLVDSSQGLCVAWSFLYLIHPRLLLVGSVRFQAMQDSGAMWETLVSEVEQLGQAVANLGIEGQLPVLAPEIQWRNVAANLKLSDHQRLKAAVLWDIISGARKAVQQQRMQLGAAMSQMLQVSHCPSKASPDSDHQPSPIALGIQESGFARRSGDSLSGETPMGNSSGTDASGLLPSLGSGSIPGRGSADGGFSGGLPNATQSQGQEQGAGGASKDSCSNPAVCVMMKGPDALHREQVLLERLQHTILKERCLILLGAESMFRHIYTPVQCAVAMVSSYPYFPDHMALLHAAATEFQPDVLDRLVAASQAK